MSSADATADTVPESHAAAMAVVVSNSEVPTGATTAATTTDAAPPHSDVDALALLLESDATATATDAACTAKARSHSFASSTSSSGSSSGSSSSSSSDSSSSGSGSDSDKNSGSDQDGDGEGADDEEQVTYRDTTRFRTWRKHTRDLYRTVIHFNPTWPSQTAQWLPYVRPQSAAPISVPSVAFGPKAGANSHAAAEHAISRATGVEAALPNAPAAVTHGAVEHTVLCGSSTGGQEQSFLKLLSLHLPTGAAAVAAANFYRETMRNGGRAAADAARFTNVVPGVCFDSAAGEAGGYGSAPLFVKCEVTGRMFHNGDVRRARFHPLNPLVFCTGSSDGRLYVFDKASALSMTRPPNQPPRPLQLPPPPETRTTGDAVAAHAQTEQAMREYRNRLVEQERWDLEAKGPGQHQVALQCPGISAPLTTGTDAAAAVAAAASQGDLPQHFAQGLDWSPFHAQGVVAAGYTDPRGTVALWDLGTVGRRPVGPNARGARTDPNATANCVTASAEWGALADVSGADDGASAGAARAVLDAQWSKVDANIVAFAHESGHVSLCDARLMTAGVAAPVHTGRRVGFVVGVLPPTVVATPEYRGGAGAAAVLATDAASIDFSPFDGARLLAGYADGGVRLWDLRAALGAHHSNARGIRPIDTVRPHAPGAHVTCVQWCPHDRHVFASGGADANVVLTRAGGRAAAEALFVHCGHTGVIHDVSWSYAEAGLIVSCDDDGIIAWAPKSALLQ